MRKGDELETGLPGQLSGPQLVRGIEVGVQEGDGRRHAARRPGRAQVGQQARLVQSPDHAAVRVQTLVSLYGLLGQGFGPLDMQGEQVGSGLIAQAQDVCETARRHQDGTGAAPLQKRIGRHRRAHADHPHAIGREGLGLRALQDLAHGRDGGVGIGGRTGQALERSHLAVVAAGDDVGEGASAIDPEAPEPVQNLTFAWSDWRCHRPAMFLRLVA